MKPLSWGFSQCHLLEWCSVVEYPHLISLDIGGAHPYYIEHLLNGRKTHLPRLTELTVHYNSLRDITQNFTRIETQRKCARVKRLFLQRPMVHGENFYRYFPSLSV